MPTGFDPARDKYVLIIGHGRSGTNLTLDLLDCHPATFCRNEPNEIAGSAMSALPGNLRGAGVGEGFIRDWRRAVAASAARHGFRDRFHRTYKQYYATPAHAIVAEKFQGRMAVRHAVGRKEGEWRAVGLQDNRIPVFKILLRPHWATDTHEHDESQHVIHVIREPVGFILSWWNRYVLEADGGPEAVYDDNLDSTRWILKHYGARLASGSGYSAEAVIETELWRWRYMNEWPIKRLSGSDRYVMRTYSELTADAYGVALSTLDWLGVALDEGTQQRLATMRNTLFSRSHSASLDRGLLAALARHVLTGSDPALQAVAGVS